MESKLIKLTDEKYYQYITDKFSNDLSILEFGYEDFTKSTDKLTPRTRTAYLLHYVISGRGSLSLNGKAYDIDEKQLFFIPPGTHYYAPNNEDPWKYYWLVFDGPKAGQFCKRAGLTGENPLYCCQNPAHIIETFSTLFEKENLGSATDFFALSALYKILAYIINERCMPIPKLAAQKEDFINQILKYFETNYEDTELRIEALSKYLHLSHPYICKIFKQIMGVSPVKYLISFRLQKACELLTKTNLSVKEISSKAGFSDQFYFSREFRKKFFISPSQYRINLKIQI